MQDDQTQQNTMTRSNVAQSADVPILDMAVGPNTQPDSSQPTALDQAATPVVAHGTAGAISHTPVTENQQAAKKPKRDHASTNVNWQFKSAWTILYTSLHFNSTTKVAHCEVCRRAGFKSGMAVGTSMLKFDTWKTHANTSS